MADLLVILLRLVQFAAAAILMGSSLFFVYGLPREPSGMGPVRGGRRLVILGAAGLAVAAAGGLLAQTTVMAGSFAEAAKPETLGIVIATMHLGKAAIVRVGCALAAVALLLVRRPPGRSDWMTAGLLGAVASASFAWSGHGAISDGAGFWIHLVSDVLHAWAASAWIGALFAFILLLRGRGQSSAELVRTHRALRRFAVAGTIFVIVLLATGLINSWYLVGPRNAPTLAATPYGRLLLIKLAAFAGMLALAAVNRFQLTPRLERQCSLNSSHLPAIGDLRRSVAFETLLGIAVLALVSWFGTLAPPVAA